ncbi:MAG TPA: SPOR domain-containing protein [Sphingomicrobium sp.]|nr:SPOR domain-containing protein [Sphingomicrobium sp.]
MSRVFVAAFMLSFVGIALAVTPARADAQYGATRETPSDALARNLRGLATDPRNFQALIGAGKAALDLGDSQAAAGFYGRAEEVWPTSPMPQIGKGAALAQDGDPAAALTYFARAQQLGASVQSFGLDRGLAYDLLGRNAEAQADYRAVLGGADGDEARRRLALSLAISNRKPEAIAMLGPLMAKGDAAGARVRALVLALTGDADGARRALEAAMPGSSYQMAPFLQRLPALSANQKAAAVHLGIFPDSGSLRTAGVGTALATTTASQRPQGDRLRSIEEMLAGTSPLPSPTPSVPPAPTYGAPPVSTPVRQPVRMANIAVGNANVRQQVSNKRFWVQLASGSNAAALPAEFRRLKSRYSDALKGLSPYIAESGERSRLLIGPFKDRNDASVFAEGLESEGVSAFSWTAPEGQMVRKLANE